VSARRETQAEHVGSAQHERPSGRFRWLWGEKWSEPGNVPETSPR